MESVDRREVVGEREERPVVRPVTPADNDDFRADRERIETLRLACAALNR
jgi:hypothetical protein